MVPLHEGIEIGSLRGTDIGLDAQTQQKPEEGRGKITPLALPTQRVSRSSVMESGLPWYKSTCATASKAVCA
jgi:hypothetical protein